MLDARMGRPGARFSKTLETFRARKAIFSPSVSKNGEVYTPEISCLKGTSLRIQNGTLDKTVLHRRFTAKN